MSGKRRKYTPEFREQAARLVIETGRPVAHVTAEIGIGEQVLGRRPAVLAIQPGHHAEHQPARVPQRLVATFCARSTSRYNAMRRGWWNPPAGTAPGVDLVDAGRRLSEDGGGAEFAALHVVRESYDGRRPGGMPRPETAHTADSLSRLAELYHRPLADLLRLNRGNGWQVETSLADGTEVRIPDRGLAPLLAARFAAAVLVEPGLDAVQRVEAIQALVPVAAANPTALDTVLAGLLLAARPVDTAKLGALLDLAENARSAGATGTSSPFHPGSPG